MRASAAIGRGVLVWLVGGAIGCFPDPNPIGDTADTVGDADTAVAVDTLDAATAADTSDTQVVADTAADAALACSSDCSVLGSACIEGYCDAGNCRTRPKDGSCDDGLVCTTGDHCEQGVCTGTEKTCPTVAAQCRESVCDPIDGQCRESAKEAGSLCTDDDACTLEDRCGGGSTAGTCVHEAAVVCSPIDDCHTVGTCNPLSGVCTTPLKNDGQQCSSAVGWDQSINDAGTCRAGSCQRLPMMALGREHSCALFADGRLYCWGSNVLGQLGFPIGSFVGDDPRRSIASKGKVPAPPATWLSAGDDVTCIVSADGVRCWGDSDGFPTIEGVAPINAPPLYLGVRDGAPVVVVRTSSTAERVCAITTPGGVRCLGYEDDGTPFGYPGVQMVGDPPWTSIDDVGDLELAPNGASFVTHTVLDAGTTICVLGADGRAKCWGDSRWLGQAISGNPYIGDDEAPSAIPFFTSEAQELVSRCYRTSFGRLACWGSNSFGQLGLGDTNPRVTPTIVTSEVDHVSAGGAFTCVVTELGDVKCWGANNYGQLGRGDTTSWGNIAGRTAETAFRVGLSSRAAHVYTGLNHACAVTRDGEIACWGRNNSGQLGIDSTNDFGDEASETSPPFVVFPAN